MSDRYLSLMAWAGVAVFYGVILFFAKEALG